MKKYCLNIQEVDEYAHDICSMITKDEMGNYDEVIAIARGGLVLSVYVAHALQKRSVIIIHGRETKNDCEYSEKNDPVLSFDRNELIKIAGKKVLVVEDIVGSGKMIKTIVEELSQFFPASVDIATLVINTENWKKYNDSLYSDRIKYVGKAYDGWVVFPWEN